MTHDQQPGGNLRLTMLVIRQLLLMMLVMMMMMMPTTLRACCSSVRATTVCVAAITLGMLAWLLYACIFIEVMMVDLAFAHRSR